MTFFHEIYTNVVLNPSPRSFFILAGVAVLIYRIPVLDKVFRTFHTLIHESGHAFASLLTGGKTYRIELYPNMSGMTLTESRSGFHRFIVSISGYPFASAFAWGGFLLILNNTPGIFHIILISVLVLQLLVNIRNTYGIVWALITLALLLFQVVKMPQLMWATAVVILTIILIESLIMSAHIFYLSLKKPKLAGDATNLSNMTGIPAVFWGLLFVSQALFFVILVARNVYAAFFH